MAYPQYRLSPNEEARILKEETERRRKLRIIQVRQQAKQHAAAIREKVKQSRAKHLRVLAAEIEDEWLQDKENRIEELENLYMQSLQHVGDAHHNAVKEEKLKSLGLKEKSAASNKHRAELRHKAAIQHEREKQETATAYENKLALDRKSALEIEKARAAAVASRPKKAPPSSTPRDDSEKDTIIGKSKMHAALSAKVEPPSKVELTTESGLTWPVQTMAGVERATAFDQVQDAITAAAEEEITMATQREEAEQLAAEQSSRADLRHRHALQSERARQEYNRLIEDLEKMAQHDRHRWHETKVARIGGPSQQYDHQLNLETQFARRVAETAQLKDASLDVTLTGELGPEATQPDQLAHRDKIQEHDPTESPAKFACWTIPMEQKTPKPKRKRTPQKKPGTIKSPAPPSGEKIPKILDDSELELRKQRSEEFRNLMNAVRQRREDWLRRASQPIPDDTLSHERKESFESQEMDYPSQISPPVRLSPDKAGAELRKETEHTRRVRERIKVEHDEKALSGKPISIEEKCLREGIVRPDGIRVVHMKPTEDGKLASKLKQPMSKRIQDNALKREGITRQDGTRIIPLEPTAELISQVHGRTKVDGDYGDAQVVTIDEISVTDRETDPRHKFDKITSKSRLRTDMSDVLKVQIGRKHEKLDEHAVPQARLLGVKQMNLEYPVDDAAFGGAVPDLSSHEPVQKEVYQDIRNLGTSQLSESDSYNSIPSGDTSYRSLPPGRLLPPQDLRDFYFRELSTILEEQTPLKDTSGQSTTPYGANVSRLLSVERLPVEGVSNGSEASFHRLSSSGSEDLFNAFLNKVTAATNEPLSHKLDSSGISRKSDRTSPDINIPKHLKENAGVIATEGKQEQSKTVDHVTSAEKANSESSGYTIHSLGSTELRRKPQQESISLLDTSRQEATSTQALPVTTVLTSSTTSASSLNHKSIDLREGKDDTRSKRIFHSSPVLDSTVATSAFEGTASHVSSSFGTKTLASMLDKVWSPLPHALRAVHKTGKALAELATAPKQPADGYQKLDFKESSDVSETPISEQERDAFAVRIGYNKLVAKEKSPSELHQAVKFNDSVSVSQIPLSDKASQSSTITKSQETNLKDQADSSLAFQKILSDQSSSTATPQVLSSPAESVAGKRAYSPEFVKEVSDLVTDIRRLSEFSKTQDSSSMISQTPQSDQSSGSLKLHEERVASSVSKISKQDSNIQDMINKAADLIMEAKHFNTSPLTVSVNSSSSLSQTPLSDVNSQELHTEHTTVSDKELVRDNDNDSDKLISKAQSLLANLRLGVSPVLPDRQSSRHSHSSSSSSSGKQRVTFAEEDEIIVPRGLHLASDMSSVSASEIPLISLSRDTVSAPFEQLSSDSTLAEVPAAFSVTRDGLEETLERMKQLYSETKSRLMDTRRVGESNEGKVKPVAGSGAAASQGILEEPDITLVDLTTDESDDTEDADRTLTDNEKKLTNVSSDSDHAVGEITKVPAFQPKATSEKVTALASRLASITTSLDTLAELDSTHTQVKSASALFREFLSPVVKDQSWNQLGSFVTETPNILAPSSSSSSKLTSSSSTPSLLLSRLAYSSTPDASDSSVRMKTRRSSWSGKISPLDSSKSIQSIADPTVSKLRTPYSDTSSSLSQHQLSSAESDSLKLRILLQHFDSSSIGVALSSVSTSSDHSIQVGRSVSLPSGCNSDHSIQVGRSPLVLSFENHEHRAAETNKM